MNETKAEGLWDQAKGKVKESFGEATDNQSIANEGAADQVKGNVKESWGNVKDSAHDVVHGDTATDARVSTEDHAESFRDKITHAAEHVKDSIKSGLDHLEHKAND